MLPTRKAAYDSCRRTANGWGEVATSQSPQRRGGSSVQAAPINSAPPAVRQCKANPEAQGSAVQGNVRPDLTRSAAQQSNNATTDPGGIDGKHACTTRLWVGETH